MAAIAIIFFQIVRKHLSLADLMNPPLSPKSITLTSLGAAHTYITYMEAYHRGITVLCLNPSETTSLLRKT